MPYKWHNILRFIASELLNYWGTNSSAESVSSPWDRSKQIMWQITWSNKADVTGAISHHWCYMINFPQQGRKLFTHNSPVMKECSRHHQLLFSTFSTVHSCHVFVLTQSVIGILIKKWNFVHWKIESTTSNTMTGNTLSMEMYLHTNITQVCSSLCTSTPVPSQTCPVLANSLSRAA